MPQLPSAIHETLHQKPACEERNHKRPLHRISSHCSVIPKADRLFSFGMETLSWCIIACDPSFYPLKLSCRAMSSVLERECTPLLSLSRGQADIFVPFFSGYLKV